MSLEETNHQRYKSGRMFGKAYLNRFNYRGIKTAINLAIRDKRYESARGYEEVLAEWIDKYEELTVELILEKLGT